MPIATETKTAADLFQQLRRDGQLADVDPRALDMIEAALRRRRPNQDCVERTSPN